MSYEHYRDDLETPITALAATRFGSRDAIWTSSAVVSFDDLSRRVDETWSRLKDNGVQEGQAVALLADNSLESVLLLLALIERGAYAFPLPLRYPEETLVAMCRSVGASTLIRPNGGQPEKSRANSEPLTVLFSDDLVGVPDHPRRRGVATSSSEVQHRSPDRTVLGIHTSGSCGAPKAAALTYANLIFSALGANRAIKLEPGDRWLLSLPLYHVGGFGILFRCLLAGACVAIPDEPREIVRSIQRSRATHLSLVPTQLRRLLSDPNRDDALRGLKSVLVGGSATPDDLMNQALDAGLPLYLTYGLTEMGSQVATAEPNEVRPNSLSVLPFRGVRIEGGEILVRGESLFLGYIVDGHVKSAVDEE
ncbi:MAG: AMP-binding protein, partial [Rhodothermia bacterium]|nr:AMP-binding protein [Rhodothermia bacterium]